MPIILVQGVGQRSWTRQLDFLEDAVSDQAADVALEVEGLVKRFPGVTALDDVGLSLRENEVLGLVGENGAGKSTLMKVLAGIYQPDAGTIRLRGRVVRPQNVRQAVGYGIAMVFMAVEQGRISAWRKTSSWGTRTTHLGRASTGQQCTRRRDGHSPRSNSTSTLAPIPPIWALPSRWSSWPRP